MPPMTVAASRTKEDGGCARSTLAANTWTIVHYYVAHKKKAIILV